MSDASLIQRLKERKLVQWALAYLAGAFAMFQAVEVLAEPWGISPAFQRAVHIVLFVGLIITFVLAWYHGEKGRQRVGGFEALIIASLLVLAAVAFLALAGAPDVSAIGPPTEIRKGPSIAVLLCKNLSADPEDEYLAESLHAEILLQLHKISELFSVGRNSVLRYAEDPLPTQEIAGDLNVEFIGECSVQKAGDQVRLIFELLDGQSGGQVWADAFDQTLTPTNLLDVNSELAQRVATGLGAELTLEELGRLETRPTDNPDAYFLYLRAEDLMRVGELGDLAIKGRSWPRAVEAYEQAVASDPRFALAHARLASAHLGLYWYALEGTDALEWARESLDRALNLNPDLGEAYLQLGWLQYQGYHDYGAALEAFNEARVRLPNEESVYRGIGAVLRRTGRYNEALQYFKQAFDLDPGSAARALEVGLTLGSIRENEEGIEWLSRARTISPLMTENYGWIAMSRLRLGEIASAREALQEAPDSLGWGMVLAGFWVESYARDFDAALRWLEQNDGPLIETPYGPRPISLFIGHLKQWSGDSIGAREAYRAAIAAMEAPGVQESRPVLGMVLTDLEVALAGSGQGTRALAMMDSTMAVLRDVRDPYGNPVPSEDVAHLRVLVGDAEAAIEVLEQLMGMQYFQAMTPAVLRLDPRWDPLRNHPRFQALLERYADGEEH